MNDGKRKDRTHLYTKLCLVFIALFLVIVIAPRVLIELMVVRKMSPPQREQMRHYLEDPVELPADWAEVKPFAPEMVRESAAIRGAIGMNREETVRLSSRLSVMIEKLRGGEALSGDERTSATQVWDKSQSWAPKFEALSNSPGYEVAALLTSEPYFEVEHELVYYVSHVFLLRAYQLRSEGNVEEALQLAQQALNLFRRHPASGFVTQFQCYSQQDKWAVFIAQAGQDCQSPETLSDLLARMNALYDALNPRIGDRMMLADAIGGLRAFKRAGYPVNLPAGGKTGNYYFTEWLAAMTDYPGWRLNRMAPDDPKRKEWQEKYSVDPDGSAKWFVFAMRTPLFEPLQKVFYVMVPKYEEMAIIERQSRAWYDLCRLAIANRIEELSGGSLAGNLQGLATKYHVATQDPFSNAEFRWNEERGVFYSVGPDQQDQHGEIRFDRSKGRGSEGDLVLP